MMKDRLDRIIRNTVMIHPYMLEECVRNAPEGLKLEFGVYSGTSINRICSVTEDRVYGFDSFIGLPEAWNGMPAGYFSTAGNFPPVGENVTLIKGWFQDTLDDFLAEHPGPVGFCHIDCDIYSAASFVLDRIKDRVVDGTIIIFDELAHYPDYLDHEYKAFLEFLEYTSLDFEFVGRLSQHSFAFKMIKQ